MSRKPDARTFGQDLMRGEHKVGGAMPKATGGLLHSGSTIAPGEVWEGGESAWQGSGTSIFDPVLVELAVRWFSPEGGAVIDPFSGGSVRGVVSAMLGRKYYGVDLSARQIEANRIQGAKICPEDNQPNWVNGNSLDIETLLPDVQADFIFSCPPYYDLEIYSSDPNDLSAMSYEQFSDVYSKIIAACVRMLKPNRFAGFVVGDIRDKDGFYRNFPGLTIQAFEAAGARLYNTCVLVTSVGSLPVRITKQFEASRKLGKTHQDFLVFCKGDPRKATEACKK